MSRQSTADIIKELLIGRGRVGQEAAERLTELDTIVISQIRQIEDLTITVDKLRAACDRYEAALRRAHNK